jgi:CHAD domain-containing protein
MKNIKTKDKKPLIQQSVIKTIDALQDHLTKPEGTEEYIHRIRVDIKHFRAWLRLLRISNEGYNWKEMDTTLLTQAKHLGTARDAEALNDTLNNLNNYAKTQKERDAIIYALEQLQSNLTNSPIDWKIFKAKLKTDLDIYSQGFVSFNSTQELKDGLKRTYKKTKQLAKKAFSIKGTHEDLHQFRKWVKYLNYQLSYLGKAYPQCNKIKKDIDRLGNTLGKAHDLVMIEQKLGQVPENDLMKTVFKLIDKNIKLILKNSHHSYKTIFNLTPEKFIQQL